MTVAGGSPWQGARGVAIVTNGRQVSDEREECHD
jgi:hypothetical protein